MDIREIVQALINESESEYASHRDAMCRAEGGLMALRALLSQIEPEKEGESVLDSPSKGETENEDQISN